MIIYIPGGAGKFPNALKYNRPPISPQAIDVAGIAFTFELPFAGYFLAMRVNLDDLVAAGHSAAYNVPIFESRYHVCRLFFPSLIF